jgi:hypothetical protein
MKLITMHKTDSGEKAKILKTEAKKLARRAKAAMKVQRHCPRPERRPAS